MPILVRWYIKTALVYFMAGLAAGIALAVGGPLAELTAGLTPVYYHLLLVGWVTQLILGVAIWMFPKFSQEQPRGNERLAWATYILLNLGLLLRVVGEPLDSLYTGMGWGILLAVSAVLQWLGGLLILGNLWRRVKLR